MELEHKGSELCNEHKRLVHQIEHLQWHLEGCSKHKPCGGGGSNSITASRTHLHSIGGDKKPSAASTTMSCQSTERGSVCRPSYMVRMRNLISQLQ